MLWPTTAYCKREAILKTDYSALQEREFARPSCAQRKVERGPYRLPREVYSKDLEDGPLFMLSKLFLEHFVGDKKR